MFGGNSPVDNAKDHKQGKDIDEIVQNEIEKSAFSEGRDIRDEEKRGKVDLACAGGLKEGDDEADHDGNQ